MRNHRAVIIASLALVLGAPFTMSFAATGPGEDQALLSQTRQLFQPLPKDMGTQDHPILPDQVALGRMLFFDPRISLDGTTGCAKCHKAALYATDGLPKALGVKDRVNPRNSPTVLNAALQFRAHWRGERENVEDQAKKALLGPPSFGNPDYATAMAHLKAIGGYVPLFKKAFPGEADPTTPDNWAKAIGAYERTLVTPSRFDAYLQGDAQALSAAEQAGLREFMRIGCASCHNGVGVGGGSYQKFGVVSEYWKATASPEIDKGRFDLTKDPKDMYVFKVPSLRNVAMTPPYFHDGSVKTLPEAVRIMAKVQLGQELTDAQVQGIIAFLGSLTGKLPADFQQAPVLPAAAFTEVAK